MHATGRKPRKWADERSDLQRVGRIADTGAGCSAVMFADRRRTAVRVIYARRGSGSGRAAG